ncbi:MAG: PPC domain-containing protein, partial [Myxococcales bacterium]|nr:PPC domain-containing protein [Myxococcales bacterium]
VQPGGGGGGECVPDPAADEAGEPLLLMDGARLPGRTICPAGDRDTFAFDVPAMGGFDFRIDFDTDVCDLDLIVEGPGGMQVGASAGFADTERVARDGLAAGRYTARVYGVGCTSPGYDVAFDLNAEPGCQDDAFDNGAGNDAAANAADLQAAVGQALMICGGDLDYYRVNLNVGERVTFRALFTHADGDLDIRVTGPGGYLGTGLSTDDNEEVVIESVAQAGTYVLAVEGFGNAENSYRLQLDRVDPRPCMADRLEANDNNSVGQAEGLSPELYRNLTWCGDDDWQRTATNAGELVQIYITYDQRAPEMTATNAQGQPLAGFSYRPAQGNGCAAGRDGCHVLEGVSAGGLVYFVVRAGVVGQGYDLRVRVTPDNTCNEDVVRCDELEVCDYDDPSCAEAICERDGDCPAGFACYQNWCVEACANDIDCLHPSHVCKHVEGQGRCAMAGAGRVGAGCFDLTDCAGSFECLAGPDVPGGYCTRQCAGNAECGAGVCAQFDDGRYCGLPCQGNNDCRVGYACTVRTGVVGQDVRVCTPIQ